MNALLSNVRTSVRGQNYTAKLPPTDNQDSYLVRLPLFMQTSCFSNATESYQHTKIRWTTSVYVWKNENISEAEKEGMQDNGSYQPHVEQRLVRSQDMAHSLSAVALERLLYSALA